MTKTSSGSTIRVSRAVEEPIDATFELGDELEKQAAKLTQTIVISVLSCIFIILLFSQNIYQIVRTSIDITFGYISIDYSDFIKLILSGFMIIFVIAIIITILVYLYQINNFNQHLRQRYELVSELKKTNTKPAKKKSKPALKNKPTNPIFATLDLIEEAMHELPQLIRLLKICKYFMLAIFIFTELNMIAEIISDHSLFFIFNQLEIIINFGIWFFALYSIYLLNVSEKIFMYLETRHGIIDSIRFGEPVKVPQGKSQLSRVVKYLSGSDPYIRASGVRKDGWKVGKTLKVGRLGQKHLFNAYFTGENKLGVLSNRLCIPRGKFAVFVKIFSSSITLEDIKKYHQAVMDVCEHDNTFPLRIIALQQQIDELDDDVYDHVLDIPINFGGCNSNIQVVAEDGDIYSFIPQVSYGFG